MKIVLGYIPNERGEAAYAKAVTVAAALGVDLEIINSSGRQSHTDPRLASEAELGNLLARAQQAGVTATLRTHAHEDGPDALIEASEEPDTEMLVIGLRKRSQVGKLLLGSDAQRVLLQASCPVLAVKA
jgi:nucleotide-binding universal stress UspA family protein